MTIAIEGARSGADLLAHAVHRHRRLSIAGLQERLFTMAFKRMVYAQIWEDPVVDLEALAVKSTSRIVTIASGGCNVMNYLVAKPERIYAVLGDETMARSVEFSRLKQHHEHLYHALQTADIATAQAALAACRQSGDSQIAPLLDTYQTRLASLVKSELQSS